MNRPRINQNRARKVEAGKAKLSRRDMRELLILDSEMCRAFAAYRQRVNRVVFGPSKGAPG